MEKQHTDLFQKLLDTILEYGLVIVVFLFSIIAKVRVLYKYRRGMTKMECIIETSLTGIGASLIIAVLHKMQLENWLFCGLGGFSGLLISPVANAVTKNAPIILDTIANKIVEYINKKW